jgi:hypothetical protein
MNHDNHESSKDIFLSDIWNFTGMILGMCQAKLVGGIFPHIF